MNRLLCILGLVTLSFTISSCDNQEFTKPEGKSLETPQLRSEAGVYYHVYNEGANKDQLKGLSEELIFKFGEDGKAWIISSTPLNEKFKPYEEADTLPNAQHTKRYIFATTYKRSENGSFMIEQLGELTVNGQDKQQADLQLKLTEQTESLELKAKVVSNPITPTKETEQYCRSWKIRQTKIEVSGGDLKDAFGKIFKGKDASSLPFIAQEIESLESSTQFEMSKYLKEHNRLTSIKEVTLSHSGMFTIYYDNQETDIANIESLGASNFTSFQWLDKHLSNDYLSANKGMQVRIENNFLILSLHSDIKAENITTPSFKVNVEFVLEWNK